MLSFNSYIYCPLYCSSSVKGEKQKEGNKQTNKAKQIYLKFYKQGFKFVGPTFLGRWALLVPDSVNSPTIARAVKLALWSHNRRSTASSPLSIQQAVNLNVITYEHAYLMITIFFIEVFPSSATQKFYCCTLKNKKQDGRP